MRTVIIIEGCGVTKVLTDGPNAYAPMGTRNRVIIVNVDRIKDGLEEFPDFAYTDTVECNKSQLTSFLTSLRDKIE